MVDRSSGLLYQTGQGYSQLDAQAHRDRLDGYAVVSGLEVTWDTGMDLSVSSGEALVGETSGSLDSVTYGGGTPITLPDGDSTDPRKDTIYIDSTGTIQFERGEPEPAVPNGLKRFDTYQPEPEFPSTEGTILAEVWVPAGATTLQSADVRDRRSPADVVGERGVFGSVSTDDATINNLHARGALTTNQTGLASGPDHQILYDKDETDDNSFFNPTTGEFTARESGKYEIEAHTRLQNATDGDDIFYKINRNGSVEKVIKPVMVGSDMSLPPISTTLDLDDGDVVTVTVANNNSSFGILGSDLATYCDFTREG